MAVELKIPQAGESIGEVQIGQWYKQEGDWVQRDEPVVELETDKASMDLPAPEAGRLVRILKRTGETATVGEAIGQIDPTAKPPERAKAETAAAGPATVAAPSPAATQAASASDIAAAPDLPAGMADAPPIGPAARRILAEHGLDPSQVRGTGPRGRILKEDAERAVREATTAADRAPGTTPPPAAPSPPVGTDRREQVVPMSMLRRRIAERLVEAQRNAAILTTFNEIDMSEVLRLRRERQEEFVEKYGVKLGLMSFFVKAAIDALRMFPQVNAEVRGTDIVYHNYYDIGVAVSTDRGLVVPVIRNAELLSFAEIERRIADLALRARERQLEVEELQGGTFTITNGGVFGSLLSTPILNPPQSAILGLHAIQERPVARDGQVVIRPMMYVALSYDHRIIDGRESVTFLRRIKECIEDPVRMLIEV